MRGIEQQFLSLQKGFHELIPANLLRPFDERELELLIGGICKIDTVDWQANTRLKVPFCLFTLLSTSDPISREFSPPIGHSIVRRTRLSFNGFGLSSSLIARN